MSTARLSTVVHCARHRAEVQPDTVGYTFIDSDDRESVLQYQELDQKARAIAARLQQLGLEGERALLLFLPGFDYITAFFGCLYAGVVAVPAYPPDPLRLQRTLPRLLNIIQDSQSKIILTTSVIESMARDTFSSTTENQI